MFRRRLRVVSARDTGPGTATLFPSATLRAVVTVKADDLHDTLFVYATNGACAGTYAGAAAQATTIDQNGGGTSELADLDLGAGAGDNGVTVRRTGRYGFRYTLINQQAATGMKTVCAMLLDTPGDPRYPGNPRAIAANHVWQTASAPIR